MKSFFSSDEPKKAFYHAALKGDLIQVKHLLAANKESKFSLLDETHYYHEADIGKFDDHFFTALEIAALKNHIEVVQHLKNEGAKISKKFFKSKLLSGKMLEALQGIGYRRVGFHQPQKTHPQYGYRMDSNGIMDEINNSSDGSNLEVIRAWIDYDPECINREFNHSTPIRTALYNGDANLIKLLLENDAELPEDALIPAISIVDTYDKKRGETRCLAALKVLVAYNAGKNPTLNAKAISEVLTRDRYYNLAVIEYLCTLEIDWNYLTVVAYGKPGLPLLHLAFSTHPDVIPYLCKAGADINQINNAGLTLLQVLASGQMTSTKQQLLKMILQLKPNPVKRAPHSNMTAYQIAYTENNHLVAQQLAEYMTSLDQTKFHPTDTLQAQQKQLEELAERSKPKMDQQAILARLRELEEKEKMLQVEKTNLLALLEQKPLTVSEYNRQDMAEIKAMLVFYVDMLTEYPAQVPELLRKVAVSKLLDSTYIQKVITSAFAGVPLKEDDRSELENDLKEINKLATQKPTDLHLKSGLPYSADDIAKIVYDMSIVAVLENQKNKQKYSLAASLKRTGSPLHREDDLPDAEAGMKPQMSQVAT